MLAIEIEKRVQKFIVTLLPKHARQIQERLFRLAQDPYPPDSKQLKNSAYRGADSGEYRIIYRIETNTLRVYLIGKRNDGEVYRRLERLKG